MMLSKILLENGTNTIIFYENVIHGKSDTVFLLLTCLFPLLIGQEERF